MRFMQLFPFKTMRIQSMLLCCFCGFTQMQSSAEPQHQGRDFLREESKTGQ
uniref:Uncharacterized protein n=1 Tax=Anguilla anguilla TaxID=7936 RepID=A0A0E9QIZ8_ANGAN